MVEGRVYNDKEEYASAVLRAQSTRIRDWVHYLVYDQNNAGRWSDSIRYIALASVARLGAFVPAAGEFEERRSDRTSVDNFPALNEEAIAATLSALQAHVDKKPRPKDDDPDLAARLRRDPTNRNAFTSLSFGSLYAKALGILEKEKEGIDYSIIKGEWEPLPQGTSLNRITALARGTGWCIADEDTVRKSYSDGDFYFFRTPRKEGEGPSISRIAVYVVNGQVREIRGVGKRQNLEGRLGDVLEAFKREHASEIEGWEQYQRRIEDSRKLGAVEVKMKEKPPVELSREELLFLYELKQEKDGKLVPNPIQSFGYERDERIEYLQEKRKYRREEDMCIVFNCKPEQIARKKADLQKPGIVAYVGQLFNDFYKELPANVRLIYQRFPGKPIPFHAETLENQTATQMRAAITGENMTIYSFANQMLDNLPDEKGFLGEYEFVEISVAQLGFPNGATRGQLFATNEEIQKGAELGAAQKLGLELVPAKLAPQWRAKYKDQPDGYLVMGMKPITVGGYAHVFALLSDGGQLGLLSDYDGDPDSRRNGNDRFVFLRRK